MKVFLSVIFSLFVCFFTAAQDSKATFELAKRMYENENYESAITLSERVLFFDANLHPNLSLLIADSYFKLQNWQKASDAYERSFFNQTSDSIKNEIILKKAVCYLLQNRYLQAQKELFSIEDNAGNYFVNKRDLYLSIVLFKLDKIDEAKILAQKAIVNSNELYKDSLQKGWRLVRKSERINKNIASTLSLIIPGSGQIYNGDIKDGLNSFGINMVFAALFTYTSITYSVLDSFISIFPWFQRYYLGGMKNARQSAIKNKEKKLNQSIVFFITQYDKSLK